MNTTAYTASSGRPCHSAIPSMTRLVIVVMVCLGDPGAVDLGQVRGYLPVGQPFRRQGNDYLIDSGPEAHQA